MKLQVIVFAAVRQQLGAETITLNVAGPLDGAGLRRAFCERFPQLTDLVSRARFAVDREFVTDDDVIPAGGEVALILPVSGG